MICRIRTVLLITMILMVLPRVVHAVNPKDVRVESIDIHGNETFSDDEIRSLMAVRTSGFLHRSFYDPKVFQDDLENIRLFYRDEGFLDASIARVQIDSVGNRFDIDITVSEGPRTYVQNVLIIGNTVFPDEYLLELIPLKSEEYLFRSPRMQEGIRNIMAAYGKRGYIAAAVDPEIRINKDVNQAIVNFVIAEGKQYTVADIQIIGLRKTKSYVVRREIPLKKGNIFDYTKILVAEQNLYATGLFNVATLEPVAAPYDSSVRILLARVQERKSGEFAVGGGYESIDGLRGTLMVRNNNLLGTARQAGFDGQVSQAGYRTVVSYMQPWTLGIRLRTDLNSVYEYRNEPAFDTRRIGFNSVFTRRIRPYTDASVSSRIERVKVSNIVGDLPDDVQRSNIRGVGFNVVFDNRNDLLNTRHGVYLETRNELVGTFLRGSEDFATTILNARLFRPAGRITIGASWQVGWKKPFGDTVIPVNERFFAGGPNSLRGWDYQELGSTDIPGELPGGLFITVGSIELRARIWSIFGIALFFDAGNVWPASSDFRTSEIRYDVGLGPRVYTPFGIIRGDFAFKLDRMEGEKLNQFWFALGQSF